MGTGFFFPYTVLGIVFDTAIYIFTMLTVMFFYTAINSAKNIVFYIAIDIAFYLLLVLFC
jgi:hypothetical protein